MVFVKTNADAKKAFAGWLESLCLKRNKITFKLKSLGDFNLKVDEIEIIHFENKCLQHLFEF
jgi:hypothetical protein